MTLPAFLFGTLVAALVGSVFHFWRGGGPGHLILYLVASLLGFWLGHFLGGWFDWTFWTVGPVHFGMALFGSAILVVLAYWLRPERIVSK